MSKEESTKITQHVNELLHEYRRRDARMNDVVVGRRLGVSQSVIGNIKRETTRFSVSRRLDYMSKLESDLSNIRDLSEFTGDWLCTRIDEYIASRNLTSEHKYTRTTLSKELGKNASYIKQVLSERPRACLLAVCETLGFIEPQPLSKYALITKHSGSTLINEAQYVTEALTDVDTLHQVYEFLQERAK
ncbi:MAG: hypothetical protein ACK5NA_01570 [Enterococcus sp.]